MRYYKTQGILKQPHGGIIVPLERRIKLESTAPATRNKLGVVKVDAMFFFQFAVGKCLKLEFWQR